MKPPVIETERLTLRPFVEADVDALVAAVFSNPQVMATLPHDPRTPEEQAGCAREYIDNYSSPWPKHGYGGWAVCSRSDSISPKGTLLGFCGFELGHLKGLGAELGFGYAQSCWGKGVGSEAALASRDWYFTQGGLHSFYACFHPINMGSKRILEKIGMKYHGDEDLWGSVEKGIGRLPLYTLDRDSYSAQRQSA